MATEIKIYKNGELLADCKSIQEAGAILKQDTNDDKFRFSVIQRGYCFGEAYAKNGSVYTFKASEEDAERRRKQMIEKGIY